MCKALIVIIFEILIRDMLNETNSVLNKQLRRYHLLILIILTTNFNFFY